MADINERIHDEVVKHRIALSRYSTNIVHKVIAQLNRVEKAAMERLLRSDNESLAGQRLEQLLTEVRQIQSDGWGVIRSRVNDGVTDLAGAEVAFTQRIVRATADALTVDVFTAAPALDQVMAAVRARPFQGRFLKGWLDDVEEKAAARVRDVVRQGFIDGTPTQQIVRTLRGTAANQYKDGVLEGSRRGVEAMVRTALTHTANVAQEAVYEANSDVIEALIWTSTLDGRTSEICQARSEQEFPIGSGPRPPAHVNCRSVMRPKVAPIPGVAPFKPTSYNDWLKKQSAETQDDILGVTKGKLFRSGVPVDRFVDRAGKTLTIEQLRQRDSSAFEKAKL